MKKLRLYADTSVFGGYLDAEFQDETRALFAEIKEGKFLLLVSDVTVRELAEAPEDVQRVLASLPEHCLEPVPDSQEIQGLRDAYLEAGILGLASRRDAEHIAAATVADADIVVSWNFRHIVHYDKIRRYEAVNLVKGYKALRIHSPREVVEL